MPPSVPSSASTCTPRACAYATMCARLAHVLVERLARGVDHHRGVAGVDRGARELLALAVVEVQRDRRRGPVGELADDRDHVVQADVLDRALRRLDEQRRASVAPACDHGARRLEVEDVEAAERPALSPGAHQVLLSGSPASMRLPLRVISHRRKVGLAPPLGIVDHLRAVDAAMDARETGPFAIVAIKASVLATTLVCVASAETNKRETSRRAAGMKKRVKDQP